MKKILMIITGLLFYVFGSGISTAADPIGIQFEQGKISAELTKIPLKQITGKLLKDAGIRFKCDESLLDTEVSVQFEAISLEEGLKRILKGLNYSFEYGKDNTLKGVVIVGAGKLDANISAIVQLAEKPENPPEPFIGTPERDSEAFKIIPNSPTPGGPVDEKELPSEFQVIENAQQPGEPVSDEKQSKIIQNAQPSED